MSGRSPLDDVHLGCGPPANAEERMKRATRYLRRSGETGVAAQVAVFMWGTLGMDLIMREQLILEQWPTLSEPDQTKARVLFNRIVAADAKAHRKASAAT